MARKSDITDETSDGLAERQTPAQRDALKRLMKLAEEQGVEPLDFDELLAKADFWPEDESIDDFLATIRRWRDEGG